MNLLIISDDEFLGPRLPECQADILVSCGFHMGFASFNTYIHRARPRLFLHGHQHQQVESFVGGTRVIGTYGYRFWVLPE